MAPRREKPVKAAINAYTIDDSFKQCHPPALLGAFFNHNWNIEVNKHG
ncbi:MAG: hypothetical protein LBE70_01995 [Nitrososphaerota archaeon]|jgi:hypothetical protein|nr:hypothetical protein [Nitrososphaerota archaeon]